MAECKLAGLVLVRLSNSITRWV